MRITMGSFRAAVVFAGLFLPFAMAAPAPVAEELVLTPIGMRPISAVHEVPSGARVAHVGEDVHIINAAGKVLHVAEKPLANAAKITKTQATATSDAVEPLATGWVAYAYWTNTASSPISSFATTWSVPPTPATNSGQTIFLFNSIEPASGDAIIQPVLQWGPSAAGGGAYWALASWYLVGSQVYYSSVVKTSVGTALNGLITLTSSSGSSYNYVTAFTGVSGTSLTVTGAAELVWATETLEVYGVTKSSDFPAGSTVFSGIDLALSSGTPSTSWSTVSSSTDGLTTTVNTNGYSNAKITIAY